jgi:hypothetical protein
VVPSRARRLTDGRQAGDVANLRARPVHSTVDLPEERTVG